MLLNMRIRVVRQSLKFSQSALAASLHVSRSAIANWEGGIAVPTAGNLLMLAELANVSFEWLALSRGSMKLPQSVQSIPAVDALLVYEPDEVQLVQAYRNANGRQRLRFLQLAEVHSPKTHGFAGARKRIP